MLSKSMILWCLFLSAPVFCKELPEGWIVKGSDPTAYDVGISSDKGYPSPSAYMRSNEAAADDKFGTIMQSFYPKKFLGKRVRMTAWVKAKDIVGWAGLWMRVDSQSRQSVSFDNMQDRAIKGDSPWRQYSIVLEVPSDSENVGFGVLLSGSGQLWVDDFNFTIVDASIPVTDIKTNKRRGRDTPINMSF